MILQLPPTLRHQRSQLAESFTALAALARRDPQRSAIDVLATMDAAEEQLATPSLFGRNDARELRGALDQARRMRLELSALAGIRQRVDDHDHDVAAAVADCLETFAAALDGVASALRGDHDSLDSMTQFQRTVNNLERQYTEDDRDSAAAQIVGYLEALGGQLRAATSLVTQAAGADEGRVWRSTRPTLTAVPFSTVGDVVEVLRSSLRPSSPTFRHAVRMAVAVPVSVVVATGIGLPRAYWVPFSVAVILKPDYSTLLSRGVGRVIGTLFGATVAAVVVSELHPTFAITTVLVALTAWLAYSLWSASFPIAIGFVTALILIVLSTAVTDTIGTAADRFIDVALGAAIAVAAYVIWPTPARAGVAAAQADLFFSLSHYQVAVTDILFERRVDAAHVTNLSRTTRVAWATTEAAVGRSIQEPRSTRVDPAEGRGLLAAAMRIVRAQHALRIEAARGASTVSSPALDALGTGLSDDLASISDHFRQGSPPSDSHLRNLFTAAADDLSARSAPPSIATHLDELVNAVNTARVLISQSTP